jgi:ABC-2 type transport system ATP-binding protein
VSTAIQLESVSKRYGRRTVVEDVSFGVEEGEIVGFLGPNGAGKTTTLRMIAGVSTATSGRVSVNGRDMATHNQEASLEIGYLPEHPPLYDVLDVESYLRFVAQAKRIRKSEIPHELERVAAACHLEAVFRREVFKLSKGYRQRLGLAQALLGKPRVLLLDEPTAGLDPGQIQETREVIRSFGERHAVLLSTHILAEVTMICRRVAIIHHGRLLAIDSPAALQRAFEESDCVMLHVGGAADGVREELLAIPGVTGVRLEPLGAGLTEVECQVSAGEGIEARIARAVAARWELRRLERRQPTLETIFLRYVGGPR